MRLLRASKRHAICRTRQSRRKCLVRNIQPIAEFTVILRPNTCLEFHINPIRATDGPLKRTRSHQEWLFRTSPPNLSVEHCCRFAERCRSGAERRGQQHYGKMGSHCSVPRKTVRLEDEFYVRDLLNEP